MNRFLTQAIVFGSAIGAGNGNALGNPLKINPGRLSLTTTSGAQQIHNTTTDENNNNGGYNRKYLREHLLFVDSSSVLLHARTYTSIRSY